MASSKDQPPERLELDAKEIEALLSKAAEGPLEPSEIDKLRRVIETLRYLTGELEKKRVLLPTLFPQLFLNAIGSS